MNPSLKFLLVLIISLEISIVPNLFVNLGLIAITIIVLLKKRLSAKYFLALLLWPLLAAIAIFVAIYYYSPGHDLNYALTLFTRLYVYVFLGAYLTKTTSALELARSFEQNLHLPSKFAYGSLAAFNVIPRMREEVSRIHAAALMRNVKLSFWSPRLYFKTILSALNWADGLTQGMISHGYRENQKRSTLITISLTKKDWLLFCVILAIFQPILFCNYL